MIATRCTAVRNCCAAFSYELRGRAAAQLRGNIVWNQSFPSPIWTRLKRLSRCREERPPV